MDVKKKAYLMTRLDWRLRRAFPGDSNSSTKKILISEFFDKNFLSFLAYLFFLFCRPFFKCSWKMISWWYFGGFLRSLIFLGDPELWKMLLSYFDDDEKTLGPRLPLPPSDSSTLPSIGNISEGSRVWLLWRPLRGGIFCGPRPGEAAAARGLRFFLFFDVWLHPREQRVAGILADPANKESFALISKQLKRYCKRASTRALFQQVDFDSLNYGELVKSIWKDTFSIQYQEELRVWGIFRILKRTFPIFEIRSFRPDERLASTRKQILFYSRFLFQWFPFFALESTRGKEWLERQPKDEGAGQRR